MKESEIRPPEILSPKGSAFLANMRSHQKVFRRLAEFGKKLRDSGTDSPEGVEKVLRSNECGQSKSHFQDHLDERSTPHLSVPDGHRKCQDCSQNNNKHPRPLFSKKPDDNCNAQFPFFFVDLIVENFCWSKACKLRLN